MSVPDRASQKCTSISTLEYIRGLCQIAGTSVYREPKMMKATQPSAPAWTWPTVQSV